MEQAVMAGDRYSSVGETSTRNAAGVTNAGSATVEQAVSRKNAPYQMYLKCLADKGNNQNQSSCGRAIDGKVC